MTPKQQKNQKINFWSEKGATLLELVVIIIILSIVVPAMFTIVGQLGIHHVQNEGVYRAVSIANSKMEEIVAFKQLNDDWADNISDFAGTESIAGGFTQTVAVTTINNWISTGAVSKDGSQVNVSVAPPIGSVYTLSVIFAID